MKKFGVQAPLNFSGSLEELYQKWTHLVMLNPVSVELFHKQLITYYTKSKKPIYLIRQMGCFGKGQTVCNQNGFLLRACDNSPAWWIHYQLYTEEIRKFNSFQKVIDAIPCCMINIKLPVHINKIGWHVAHIFNVKDGNTNIQEWGAEELLRKTLLNVHPCNYFYIPKTDWQTYGGDPNVITCFYNRFKERYHNIWDEFLHLVASENKEPNDYSSEFIYEIGIDSRRKKAKPIMVNQPLGKNNYKIIGLKDLVVWYKFHRLCFKADIIEPLMMTDKFGVFTPNADFVMTKQEFYHVFENVVKSRSYRENRIYHYPKSPKKAEHYLSSIIRIK